MYLTPEQQIPLSQHARNAIGALEESFTQDLTAKQKQLVLDAFIATDKVTNGRIAPREFQLRTLLALKEGNDVVVRAGTGYGKTLAMLLAILLTPDKIAIIASPTKLLQADQVEAIRGYGLNAILINEDTPYTDTLWQDAMSGNHADVYLVAPEQMFKYHGHIPRFMSILEISSFTKRVGCLLVDEAHFIATSGMPENNEPAHRPAYGRLGEFRARLPVGTPVGLFSATLPPAVLEICKSSLHMKEDNTVSIMLPTNRPNLTHAVIPMKGAIKNFDNLNFIVPQSYQQSTTPPTKCLIFIDSKLMSGPLTNHLLSRFSKEWRVKRPIRHIHSDMSKAHIKDAYSSFENPEGDCFILVATATAANGINVPNIGLVILYGVPKNMMDFEQKSGRGGRADNLECLVLLVAEPWAFESSEDAKKTHCDIAKVQRTESAMFDYVGLETCRRTFCAEYNGSNIDPSDCDYSVRWCCDNHTDDSFHLQAFFAAPIDLSSVSKPVENLPAMPRKKYRSTNERDELVLRLTSRRDILHSLDSVYNAWPVFYLLSDAGIDLLSRTHPSELRSPADVTQLLSETDEWRTDFAHRFLLVIKVYDAELEAARQDAKQQQVQARRAAILKKKRMAGRDNGEDSDEREIESEDDVEGEASFAAIEDMASMNEDGSDSNNESADDEDENSEDDYNTLQEATQAMDDASTDEDEAGDRTMTYNTNIEPLIMHTQSPESGNHSLELEQIAMSLLSLSNSPENRGLKRANSSSRPSTSSSLKENQQPQLPRRHTRSRRI